MAGNKSEADLWGGIQNHFDEEAYNLSLDHGYEYETDIFRYLFLPYNAKKYF